MRSSKSKSRKTSEKCEENHSASLQMELELAAVKAKNADLIKTHRKLMRENAEMRNQIWSLQADLLDLQVKYNNIEEALKNVTQNIKKCTPSLVDILNLFLKVSDSKKTSLNLLNITNSDSGFTPKAKAITHSVKPHTVNGTVLNLVPTISLTRLNTSTNQRSHDVSSTSPHIDYRNSLPSTSSSDDTAESQNENHSPNADGCDFENQSFSSRRNKTNSMPDRRTGGSLDLAEDDIDAGEESSDESDQEEENGQMLSTIQEESIRSSEKGRTSLGEVSEVRIYLSRLSAEEMRARRSQNASCASLDVNVNDTCLNIETTVIENPETRTNKGLRADIMVFSPHTNSTRLESDNSMFDNLSPNDNRRKTSVPAVSAIQSAEVTPSTSMGNDAEDQVTSSSRLAFLPTPSLSALGDINTSHTQLDILRSMDLTPVSLSGSNKKIDSTNHSPISTSVTLRRKTRSNKSQIRSHPKNDDESPRSSVENNRGKRCVRSCVNRQRGGSDDRPLTPTIVLERLENILPDRRTSSSVNIQIVTQHDEPKENENPPVKRETRSKKRKATTKSKSPKKSVKRKLKEDEEQETSNFQDKIREIQIRISNYIPETSQNGEETPIENNQRPKRAARPTTLKDASLKGVRSREKFSSKRLSAQKCTQKFTMKLRRMF